MSHLVFIVNTIAINLISHGENPATTQWVIVHTLMMLIVVFILTNVLSLTVISHSGTISVLYLKNMFSSLVISEEEKTQL